MLLVVLSVIHLCNILCQTEATCQNSNCIQCLDNTQCGVCNDGYYLESGGCTKCSDNCALCSESNTCDTCKTTYWNLQSSCAYKCPMDCLDRVCDDQTGDCLECIPGRYGPRCRQDCSLCRSGECGLRKCINGCKDGYIQVTSYTGYSYCALCPANCVTCSNTTYCTRCEQGYYRNYYRIPMSGRGTVNCLLCSYIGIRCISNTHCGECQLNSTQGCDALTLCTYASSDPGTLTTTTTTATTTPGLAPKTSTATATRKPSLKRSTTSHPVTSTTTGEQTGSSDEQKDDTGDDDNGVVVAAGAGAGALVFLLIIVVVVVVYINRRRARKEDDQSAQANINNHVRYENQAVDFPVYAKPNKQSGSIAEEERQGEEYLYAQPNKPDKTSSGHRAVSDLQEPPMDTHVVVDLDIESVQETNHYDVILEDLDKDVSTSNIDMGESIPTSDIYYNMESLIRSQVQVSKLQEYVRNKSDYETEFKKFLPGLQRSCNEALKRPNRAKNRYNGIYAYDATRVVLQSGAYINANYNDGHKQSKSYIASLGPTSDAMNKYVTFWEMIWQENVEAIVMLTNLEEGEKMKCEQYWPAKGKEVKYGDYKVKSRGENVFPEYVVREFVFKKRKEAGERVIFHYQYTAWPDRSVPDTVVSLVQFRDRVEQQDRSTTAPLVVHCSAGIGRTGTYIALDVLIKQGQSERYVDIFGCVNGLRGQRVNMVQNQEQYEYLHQCVAHALSSV